MQAHTWVYPCSQVGHTHTQGRKSGRQTDLKGIWICKADLGPPLDARPQVIDLGSNVAERQVADHYLLLHFRWLDVPSLTAIPRCPCDLRGRKMAPTGLYLSLK